MTVKAATRIIKELYPFLTWPRAYTVPELYQFVDSDTKRRDLEKVIRNSPHLIRLGTSPSDERFILDKTLFHWFCDLNILLAHCKCCKLTRDAFIGHLNLMRYEGSWHNPPAQAIKWSERLGLIGSDHSQSTYTFPLARLLAQMSCRSFEFANRTLYAFGERRIWCQPLGVLKQRALNQGFSQFRARIVDILKAKNGLTGGGITTLTELSKNYGVSRERIRQIESSFWHRLSQGRELLRIPFILALLYDFISEGGRLVIDNTAENRYTRLLLAKCAGIDCAEIRDFELTILGTSEESIKPLLSKQRFSTNFDKTTVTKQIENNTGICLCKNDLRVLAEGICSFVHKHLNIADRICIVLRKIGRPAHYTEITHVHNSIFTNCSATDNAIHAVLLREKNRIVWIGTKGTFALKELGYRRPSKTLCETITAIVRKAYECTNKPVPFTVVQAEIGKHRYSVSQSSLIFATHFNPELRRVSKDTFVPKSAACDLDFEIDIETLDNALRTIEQEKDKK